MASNSSNKYHQPTVIGGVVLIVLGLVFLVQSFLHIDILDKLWPLFLVAAGLGIVISAKSSR